MHDTKQDDRVIEKQEEGSKRIVQMLRWEEQIDGRVQDNDVTVGRQRGKSRETLRDKFSKYYIS